MISNQIAVIGAGFYGSYIALTLANKGHSVLLIDPEDKSSATLHCQARLHSGMFYVRSIKDLVSCARNFTKFFKVFKPYVYSEFKSYYLIDKNSNVDFDSYKKICKETGLKTKEVKLDYVNSESVQGILETNEFSINTSELLSNLILQCKNHKNITFIKDYVSRITENGSEIKIDLTSNDPIKVNKCILASYGNNFTFLKDLGYKTLDFNHYKIPVIKYTDNLSKDCHAVVDGDFWSSISLKDYKLLTNKFNLENTEDYWNKSLNLMKHYIPELEAELIQIDTVEKYVLTNSREARITRFGNKNFQIYSVFSGKLTNIFDIINQIEEI